MTEEEIHEIRDIQVTEIITRGIRTETVIKGATPEDIEILKADEVETRMTATVVRKASRARKVSH
jgi:hypothetical protein